MEQTAPARRCPQCSQPLAADVETCSTCGRDDANPFTAPAAPVSEPKPREYGFEILFAVAVVVSVCMIVSLAVPGLGVLLGMVFVPAVVRAAAVMKRKREAAGAANSASQIASALFASAGITVAVWLGSSIACTAVCTPVMMAAFAIDKGSEVGVAAAFGLGGVAGLASFFWFMRRLWPRAAKDDDATA